MNNLSNASQIILSSTTESAKMAAKEKGAAAIASKEVAELHDLNILRSGIHDIAHNSTRFLVIGTNDAASTGKDRTSIMFSIKAWAAFSVAIQ